KRKGKKSACNRLKALWSAGGDIFPAQRLRSGGLVLESGSKESSLLTPPRSAPSKCCSPAVCAGQSSTICGSSKARRRAFVARNSLRKRPQRRSRRAEE